MRALLVVACAGAQGCSGDPVDAEREHVLERLAEHRAADVDPRGFWLFHADGSMHALQISASGSGRFTVREFGTDVVEQTRTAEIELGILELDGSVAGSARLHLCRIGDEEFLLPEESVRFETGPAKPTGTVFRRVPDEMENPRPDLNRGYLPGPEDEVHPMRRVEGDDY